MIEIILSSWMRDYFEKVNKELSDREKATLIWNVPNVTWNERLDALKELEDETADVILQKQIQERLDFEQEEFDKFKKNINGKFVYTVEDDDWSIYGVFSNFETAHKKVLKCIEKYAEFNPLYFEIKKQFVCSADETEDIVEKSEYENASVIYDMQGRITYFYTSTDNDLVKDSNRFENAFFRIPCGMNYCSVKVLEDNSYGVIHSTEEKWEAYMDKWNNGGLDYSDIQVIVYCLTENGLWSHSHINPLFLEPQMPEKIEGDEKRMLLIEATNALVNYFNDETEANAAKVIETAKKYADECQKQNMADVKCIEDIFC